MVLMLWFYVSGIALLLGAELNAEIEHASPYGKAPGERVPGEKKSRRAARGASLRGEEGEGRTPDQAVCLTGSTATSTADPPPGPRR